MVKAPPNWRKVFQENLAKFSKSFGSDEFAKLTAKANEDYLHWDQFRHKISSANVSAELAWVAVKMSRTLSRQPVPIVDENESKFSYFLTPKHYEDLSYIDRRAGGVLFTEETLPHGEVRKNLVINGLMEEAISSSQIEGANTTRKVAKEMIESKRSPKTKSEQMIFNNYIAMSQLEFWKERKLNDQFILELHRVLAEKTMDESDIGRFRRDNDQVVIMNDSTSEIAHIPPKMEIARRELDQLYKFINEDSSTIHPVVKATILHFFIGYIHPFVDGNGRCARALFYWYLIKEKYWMFQYMPISLQIKKEGKTSYDRAFQYVETDEGDLTYFLTHQLKTIRRAIDGLVQYLQLKERKARELKKQLVAADEINNRQLDLISKLQRDPIDSIDIESYRSKNKIAYETARKDLMQLVSKRILKQSKVGLKKYLYSRGENFPSK